MRLDQAAPVLGAWHGGNETVAEHIITALGRRPKPGEACTVDGVEVEIEVVEGENLASVIVGHKSIESEMPE